MWYIFSIRVAPATSCKALFTRNVCVNVNINFNIVFMMTEMQTQRIGWTHFLRLRHYWHNAKLDANIDFDTTREHTFKQHYSPSRRIVCRRQEQYSETVLPFTANGRFFFHSAWNGQ